MKTYKYAYKPKGKDYSGYCTEDLFIERKLHQNLIFSAFLQQK